MNGESLLVDTSVLIDYFEGMLSRKHGMDKLERGLPGDCHIIAGVLQVDRAERVCSLKRPNASIDSLRLTIRFIFWPPKTTSK
jgi:hypothetical protein